MPHLRATVVAILPSRKCFPVKNKLHKINNLWSYLLRTKGVAFRIDIVKITDFGKTRNSQIIKKFMDTQIEDISNILELNFKKNLIVSNFTKKKCFFICKNSFFLDPITLPINHGIIYNSVSKYKPKIPFFSVESKVILSNW